MDDKRVRILSETVLSDDWARLSRYELERQYRDGTWHREVRQVYDRGNAAAVIPVDRERGTVLLVRQWRIPVWLNPRDAGEADGMLLEACAGLNDGDDPATAIRREAEEELGYRLGTVDLIGEYHMSAGSVAERLSLYVADYTPADRISTGGGLANEGEDIEVIEMPLGEAFALLSEGRISDAKTVIMLQYLKLSGYGG